MSALVMAVPLGDGPGLIMKYTHQLMECFELFIYLEGVLRSKTLASSTRSFLWSPILMRFRSNVAELSNISDRIETGVSRYVRRHFDASVQTELQQGKFWLM